ncbi:SPASM domain-containing protein [Thermofilum sp.]|uniref:SPASM domain-containing protein n=1 Tax=Thermofilum sp. TaxID=1961369 RepID=UPI00319DB148
MHEIREAVNLARKIGVDAIRIASARVYTGTDVIKPTKDSYEVSKEYLPEPGSRFSHYTSDLKRVGSKKIYDWLWKRIVTNPDGSVSSCCAYYSQKYDFGNISNKSVKSVYNNDKYVLARKSQRTLRLDFGYEGKMFPVLYVYHWATSWMCNDY